MKSHKHIQVAGVMAAVSVLFQMAAFSPCASAAKHFVSRKNTVAVAPTETTLMRLKKVDSLWTVLEDSEVKQSLKEIMGTAVEKYFDATQITEIPNVKGDELYSAGGVRGLYTVSESFFDLNLRSKKLCVIVLNEGDLAIYGVASFEQLPQVAREYIEDLQSLCDEGRPKLNIQFKKPENAPVAVAKTPEPKRNLKLGVVTGSYSRVDSDPRFERADFKVQRIAGNKIKFCCTAVSGSHTGEASAVVPIVNNAAEYSYDFDKGNGYKLSMQFDGKYVYVSQEGEGFGGIGVTASGTYQKMDDKTPQIEAEQK